MPDVTQILTAIEEGDSQAAEKLLPLVYEELRKLARHKMAQESPDNTLQAAALVHEAFIRLVGSEQPQKLGKFTIRGCRMTSSLEPLHQRQVQICHLCRRPSVTTIGARDRRPAPTKANLPGTMHHKNDPT